jgi:peptidoglycan/xylan/chitin deacetylase (PgdA/CDA1 family)
MWRVIQRIKRVVDSRAEPAIIMYHRVATPPFDPWGLSVSPQYFLEQMLILKHLRIPLRMDEFVSRLAQGTLPRLAVAVTFDDGYRDNLEVAKPILTKVDVPATVFLSTGSIGTGKPFWWDELARLVLGHRGEAKGSLFIAGQPIDVSLPGLRDGTEPTSNWRAWEPARTARETLYFRLWSHLSDLATPERESGMRSIRELLRLIPPSYADDLPMNPEHISNLVADSLIDVGAHTVTHPHLTALTSEEQQSEIGESRTACESLTGYAIDGFAYPHGDLDAGVKAVVQENGFRWACSTRCAAVHRSNFDRFDLPRIQVLDWTGQELERVLSTTRSEA